MQYEVDSSKRLSRKEVKIRGKMVYTSAMEYHCLTSCNSVVLALVCQPSGPGSIPGMSHLESDIDTTFTTYILLPCYLPHFYGLNAYK